MTRPNLVFVGLLILLVRPCGLLAADLTIAGAVPKPQAFALADLKSAAASSIKSIEFTSHGDKHHANAIPLTAALALAGLEETIAPAPNVSPSAKHPPLRMVAIVRGSDGYAVAFSLGELLSSVGNHEAYLALDQDDQPLTTDGPLKLIVPSDTGPARAVRNVLEIDVIDLAAPTSQPVMPR